MTRWDEILSLPVQNPPTMEFGACDLQWSKIKAFRDNLDRLALIPYPRVDDFVRGESNNKDSPTSFQKASRRTSKAKKAKVDGTFGSVLYWCSYGPQDHRPSRASYIPKKKSAGRPSIKRGCTCRLAMGDLLL
nr:zinc ion binding protein [Tanacetum cinerariifolium]